MKPIFKCALLLILVTLYFSCGKKTISTGTLVTTTENEMELTTYYFIRHAEKVRNNPADHDPDLTPEGIARAKRWATFFEKIDLDAIYTTDYKRTRQTAAPIANRKNLQPQLYKHDSLYTQKLKVKTLGKTVLMVGHSNTNPYFVNSIIGEQKYTDMDDDDYGTLYIVTLAGGNKKVEVLKIE